jgi:eukaryotic-like serine/threonine-protein kinase
VRVGDVIAGKYRIEKILGAGGMGVVVAAHDEQLDRKVAIKFLLPEVLNNAEVVRRFKREAQAAVKIKSEHVATVYEVGALQNGSPFMVMEHLDGGDLNHWLEQKGVLPCEQAVEFVLQACEAIAEAHGHGIVHRDLKPANLFCIRRADGILSVKVLDFGISKHTGSNPAGASMDMTATTAVMGSPYYMSPEQLRSTRDVDTRTDIWALGVILFQLLTKRTAFDSETVAELFVKILHDDAPRLRELRPDAPETLEQVICKCLQKDRELRYPNVAELAIALAPCAPKRCRESVDRVCRTIQNAGLSASVLQLPPSSDLRSVAQPAQTDAVWQQTTPPVRNTRKWLAATISGVFVAFGFAVFAWTKFQVPAGNQRQASTAAALQTAVAPISTAAALQTIVAPTAAGVQPIAPAHDAGTAEVPSQPVQPSASGMPGANTVGSEAKTAVSQAKAETPAQGNPPQRVSSRPRKDKSPQSAANPTPRPAEPAAPVNAPARTLPPATPKPVDRQGF